MIIRILFTLILTLGVSRSDERVNHTVMIKSFTLSDQFGSKRGVNFPRTNALVITVADRNGSNQIDPWILPLKEKYGKTVAIEGIADVSAVPGFLRSKVQGKFAKLRSYPVMLDWDGSVATQFLYQKNVGNIYVMGLDGKIKLHIQGLPDSKTLTQLFSAIDELTAKNQKE